MARKRVVITGVGVVSPVGIGVQSFWEKSLNGISGVSELSRIDTKKFPTKLGAEVKDFTPDKFIKRHMIKCMDLASQFSTAAANMALEDSGLINKKDIISKAGVTVGTTLGPISFILDQQELLKAGDYKSIHKLTGYMALSNSVSSDVSIEVGAFGASETISSACISGLSSVEHGINKIRNQDYNVMIVGGTDSAFRPLPYAGLNVINILTNSKLRPFDSAADGTVLGEGAAVLILEDMEHAKKRKANIYCEVFESMMTCESPKHYFGHEDKPVQAVRAIGELFRKSGVKKELVDFVITHGLGVRMSDVFESATYLQYFGEKLCNEIFFTSVKPYIGHPLAAASAMQIAYAALMIKNKKLLPTLNFETPMKGVKINIAKEVRVFKKVNYVVVNANAFGGKCGACLLGGVN